MESELKAILHEAKMKPQNQDLLMTSSTISSLESPVDSGVQLLDSESEIASVMSACDEKSDHIMTKSDIVNQNISHLEQALLSKSVPNYFDKFELAAQPDFSRYSASDNELCKSMSDEVFEMEHPIKEPDIMNVSLNSYELLDYTLQNKQIDQMHVSMSEEVNEALTIASTVEPILEDVPVVEEQIVFRRQRKKKSKSDTPKKRVSFHEDILNSTKIDDIHINHGFITHESDVSLSFFQRGFLKKPDVVKGRYSWAAEGDAPYYEKPMNDREIKSDLYIQQHSRFYSTSSSSASSSIDEDSEENGKKEPKLTKPKSSCLKKNPKKIDTNIVEEEVGRKRRSESNLLDSNIFGSLKSILNFSSSVPLMAERGVPEGQEDVAVISTSYETSQKRPVEAIPDKKLAIKPNLRLSASEGFYPNYPKSQNLPQNVILCDSNVYEHKGISYSYEYDKFQKSFEQQTQKPKSSTVYQKILKEFNFFRRKAKEPDTEEFEIINDQDETASNKRNSVEEVEEPEIKSPKSVTQPKGNAKMDWPDNDTVISDLSSDFLSTSGKHLNSPKRRNMNHYSMSPFRRSEFESMQKSENNGNSKASLINRFLKNVTLKKLLDVNKAQTQNRRQYMSLYVKGVKYEYQGKDTFDRELDKEIVKGMNSRKDFADDKKLEMQLKREIFRSGLEKLIKIFPVRSAYATNGYSKPLLLILTDSTLYISGLKPGIATNSYRNHFVLPYIALNTIILGPNLQTIHVSNYDTDMQCIVSTGCAGITRDIVAKIEMAMRRDVHKPKLAAVKQLEMSDMANLRRAICKQTCVEKDEEYYYYSIVNIQDFNQERETTPLGPNKEGPLMFKTADMEGRWETAYFILKAGVLYMLSSSSQRVPLRVFPLINGSCQGARRIYNYPRPHTFQLVIEGRSLQLAAPDEYVASDWLQCLVTAASVGYQPREKLLTQSCSLLMTSDHIVTVREAFPCTIPSLLLDKNQHKPIKGAQVLSCASIGDLVAFRLPSTEQSWCVLEFSCREVHECSGDWILYFSTNLELEHFITTLELLWGYNNENGDSFPLSTIPETDPLSKKCVDIYTSLYRLWQPNTVHIQFL